MVIRCSCVVPGACVLALLFLLSPALAIAQDAKAQDDTARDATAQDAIQQQLSAAFDRICRDAYPEDEPGAAVIAVHDGNVIFRQAYGMASLELGVPVRPEMVFCLASATKTITATAIMALVEDGKLSLTDSAAQYLPDLSLGEGVQIQHLLSHTSGLSDFGDTPGFGPDQISIEISSDDLVAAMSGQELRFEPGTQFGYSNANFALLAKIVEVASGDTWEEFITKRIFEPAGMTHTRYGGHSRIIPGAVVGYAKDGESWIRGRALSYTHGFGLGGIFSSVDDMAAFDAALSEGKVLRQETQDQMYEPFQLADGTKSRYGLGWGIQTLEDRRVVYHSGGIFGWSAQFTRIPDAGIVVVVLTNRQARGDNPGRIAIQLAGTLLRQFGDK